MKVIDEKHIFIMKNGVDCNVDFAEDGTVESATSAVDSF